MKTDTFTPRVDKDFMNRASWPGPHKKRADHSQQPQLYKPTVEEIIESYGDFLARSQAEIMNEFIKVWEEAETIQDVAEFYKSTPRQVRWRRYYFAKRFGVKFKLFPVVEQPPIGHLARDEFIKVWESAESLDDVMEFYGKDVKRVQCKKSYYARRCGIEFKKLKRRK